MHISKPILLCLLGLALGGAAAAIVGSTGLRRAMAEPSAGETSPRALAATCDCPPAEPPLAGRFEEFRALQYIPPKGTGVKDITCPAGSYLISGSCSTNFDTYVFNVTLRESRHIGSPPNGWHCSWLNNEPMLGLDFRVAAICLKPAP